MGLSPAQIQKAAEVRKRLLRAAATMILQAGPHGLTLEAVANETGISKGGLLHHFHSKHDLLEALMDGLIAGFEDDLARYAQADSEPRGRQARAYIRAAADQASEVNRLGIAVLSALQFDRSLLRRWQAVADAWFGKELSEGDPVEAYLIRVAADGLWITDAFGLNPVDPGLRSATVNHLLDLTRI